MPEVEILTGAGAAQTRALWEEVFCEDSAAFVDYYYQNKAESNVWFVLREGTQIQSMLGLTPYMLCVRTKGKEKTYPSYYIVGVATRKECRHRGYMRRLLENAFSYMRGQGVLFTFLMPANPAIYEPFGFRYIYDRVDYQRNAPGILEWMDGTCETQKRYWVRKAEEKDCEFLAEFAMRELSVRYEFYLQRDADYYRLLQRELASENGGIFLVYVDEAFAGYYLYAKEEEEFVQEVLFAASWETLLVGQGKLLVQKPEKRPVIMGKYLCDGKTEDAVLKALADGNFQNGFVNELV